MALFIMLAFFSLALAALLFVVTHSPTEKMTREECDAIEEEIDREMTIW